MKNIYLIPDREQLQDSLALRKEYDAKWEFNDFFQPRVLDDITEQKKIINTYAKVISDFSQDTIHGAFLDMTPHSYDPMIRRVAELRATQSLEIAKELGVRGVVFHTNRIQNFRDDAYLNNWLKSSADFYGALMDKYPNIDIFVENMFDEDWDMLAKLGEAMKTFSRFGICFDYAHASIFGQQQASWFQGLAPYIRHIHINDNDGENDLHRALGDGCMNWTLYGEQMKKMNAAPSVLIEVQGIEKQRKSLEYMQEHRLYPFA